MTWRKWLGACLVLTAVLAFGCKNKEEGGGDTGTTETSTHDDSDGHTHGPGDTHGEEGETESASETKESAAEKIAANFAKLPDADRALAEKQKVCPVSGEALGEMGVPIKVHVKDQDVFLCCKGCEKPVKEDPDKYLAKLK